MDADRTCSHRHALLVCRRCSGWLVQPMPGWSLSDWIRSAIVEIYRGVCALCNTAACGFQKDRAPGSVDPDTPTTLCFCRSHTLHPLHGGNILDRNRSMGASDRLCIACACVCMRVHVFLCVSCVFLWVRIRQGAFIIN